MPLLALTTPTSEAGPAGTSSSFLRPGTTSTGEMGDKT